MGYRFGRALVAWLVVIVAAVTAPAQDTTPPATPAPAVSPFRQAKNIAIITVHDAIDAKGLLRASIERRINDAAKAGADAIVFDIDTPGGSLSMVQAICELIKNSPVPNTIAWINTHAYSGGAIIAMACREIIVNDPAALGDAMPVLRDANGMPRGLPPDVLTKVLPPMLADLADSARRYNKTFGAYIRDEYLVQAICATDYELYWVRNKQTGVEMAVDRAEYETLFPGAPPGGMARLTGGAGSGTRSAPRARSGVPAKPAVAPSLAASPDRPVITKDDAGKWEDLGLITNGKAAATFNADDLLFYNFIANDTKTVNGKAELIPIRNESDLKAFLGATNTIRYNITWSENLYDFLTNNIVRGILIVIFLVALFIEMSHPGVVLPGTIAVLALIALIAPPVIIGMAAWWEVAAILAGLALLGLEVFVIPGFGVAGIAGIILLFGGLVATFVPGGNMFPDTPQGRSDLMWGLATIVLSGFTAGVSMWQIGKHFGKLPLLNRLVLKSTPPDETDGLLSAMAPELILDVRVGDTGVTVTPMRPAGRVDVRDRVVDAVAELGFIPAGIKVRVSSVDGMRIGVEPIRDLPGKAEG